MTKKLTRFLILASGCIALSALPLAADTLSTFLGSNASNGLVVGDKVFYDFQWRVSCFSGPSGQTGVACSSLGTNVNGIDPAGVAIFADAAHPGLLGFDLTSPLEVKSDGTNDNVVDVTLSYNAAVVNSSNLITDVHLIAAGVLNPNTNTTAPPGFNVGETVTNLNTGAFLGSLSVIDPPPSLSDAVILSSPAAAINVLKDIKLESGVGTGWFANVTSINQLLSQNSQVPEPRAYAFLLAGCFGIFLVYKRRRRTA